MKTAFYFFLHKGFVVFGSHLIRRRALGVLGKIGVLGTKGMLGGGLVLYGLAFSAGALEPEGPLARAMGGAGRAVYKGAEYHLLNPASLIHFKGFQGAGFYMFGAEGLKPYWGVSVVENQQIPLGLSYIRDLGSRDQYFSISVAGFVVPGSSMGVSLSRWQVKDLAHWNITGGILIQPVGSPFAIGAAYDYILPLKGAFKEKRRWALGTQYTLDEWLSLQTDLLYDLSHKWSFAGGVQVVLSQFFILRLAQKWHFKHKEWLFSGGVGAQAKGMALDYSLSQMLKTKKWQSSIGLRVSF